MFLQLVAFFPTIQHVGLPDITQINPSADFTSFGNSFTRNPSFPSCSFSSRDQSVSLESTTGNNKSSINSTMRTLTPSFSTTIPAISSLHWRALFVEYFSSNLRSCLSSLPQVLGDDDCGGGSGGIRRSISLADNSVNECYDLTAETNECRSFELKRCDSASTVASNLSTISNNNNNSMQLASMQLSQDFMSDVFVTAGINRIQTKKIMKWMEIWAGKRRRKEPKKSEKTSRKRRGRGTEHSDDEDDDEIWDDGKYGRNRTNGTTNGDNEIDERVSENTNVLVIVGPSGAGKTAAIYACAKAVGYTVIEVGAGQDRKGADVRKLVAEAAQSHGLGRTNSASSTVSSLTNNSCLTNGSNNAVKSELNLILFDEVQ